MSNDDIQSADRSIKGLGSVERALEGSDSALVADTWDPPFHGDIDMRIASDGTWFYQGSAITRDRLVRLFSTVLRRDEDGKYFLVTPVEKVGITVDDAPFLAVGMSVDGTRREQIVTLETNVGDLVKVDAAHPLRFSDSSAQAGPKPYVLVRGRLEALVNRPRFYDLVELGVEEEIDGAPWFGVWSSGTFFAMARADDVMV